MAVLHMNKYYNKYIKYKRKYLRLKKIIGGNEKENDYYIIHGSKSPESLLNILKDGKLKLGDEVKKKYKKMGSDDDPHIYANIYFENVNNISHFWDYSLIFDPKILTKYGAWFNRGWLGISKTSIHIDKNEQGERLKNKIEKIQEFVQHPREIPDIVLKFPGMCHHELMFDTRIPLKDNLLGIVCNHCNDEKISKIKEIIKDTPYKNITILTRNYPFPKLSDLRKKAFSSTD